MGILSCIMKKYLSVFLVAATIGLASCGGNAAEEVVKKDPAAPGTRIVSLSGTTTEVLCALGLQDRLVGVDVTSTFPESVKKLPQVGHNRNMSAEAILALNPDIVVGVAENVNPQLGEQLKTGKSKVWLFHVEGSPEGARNLIRAVADSFGVVVKADPVCRQIDADLEEKVTPGKQPHVLFIYARGTGSLMVAGERTYPNSMITLAGGVNAVSGFEDFKPLTSEALVAANPDVILMFNSGLESLGGLEGLLQIQGMAQTKAGKNRQVIEMDGQFLTGFGPRTGKAIAELSKHLNEVPVP